MSILPESIEKYRKLFSFIIKYWNSDLVEYSSNKALGNTIEDDKIDDEKPEDFVNELKQMGPAYIKLGQLLSTRPDLLPESYLEELQKLQDDVEPLDYEVVHDVFEKEIGTRISKAFADFNEKPIASASIGQVHVATLHSGEKVAVKIQRPNVREKFLSDLDTLQEVASWAVKHSESARKYNVEDLIEEVRFTLLKELDYEAEAQNLLLLKENLKNYNRLYIPKPILDYSSSKVLTMEFVEGKKVTSINPLKRIEENLEPLADQLVKAYLKQVIVDGVAHADPHPGNVHITKKNHLALMDLGMVAQFSQKLQESMLQLMVGLSNYDSQQVTTVLLDISEFDREEADIEKFKKEISRLILDNQNRTAENMQTGRVIIQMNKIAAHNGIKIPVALNMLAKILLNLDQIIAVLAPDKDINRTIRAYLDELMQSKMLHELKPQNLLNAVLETKKLTENMPKRLNTIFDRLSKNEFEVKVNAIDEKRFTDAFQKVANRITLGIIIASLVLGAAMLIQIDTDFKIMGYPGLAIILFLGAAIIGFYIIYQIIVKDDSFKKKK